MDRALAYSQDLHIMTLAAIVHRSHSATKRSSTLQIGLRLRRRLSESSQHDLAIQVSQWNINSNLNCFLSVGLRASNVFFYSQAALKESLCWWFREEFIKEVFMGAVQAWHSYYQINGGPEQDQFWWNFMGDLNYEIYFCFQKESSNVNIVTYFQPSYFRFPSLSSFVDKKVGNGNN